MALLRLRTVEMDFIYRKWNSLLSIKSLIDLGYYTCRWSTQNNVSSQKEKAASPPWSHQVIKLLRTPILWPVMWVGLFLYLSEPETKIIHSSEYFQVNLCICFLFLQLEYKKGHEERVSKYTAFVDPPEVLLAKKQGQIVSDVSFSLSLP